MAEQPDYGALIADLEAERDELNGTIAFLRRKAMMPPGNEGAVGATANIASRDGAAGRDTAVIQGRVRPDEFFRLSIADAVKKYLSIMKQPQNPTAIVNGLKSGGVLTNAKNFYANVNTELKRMKARDVLVNTPSGWGLAEWYPSRPKDAEPAKKKGKKKKSASKSGKKAAHPKSDRETLSGPAAGDSAMNWHQFLGAATKAGKTMKEASAEWNKRKASQA